MYTAFDIHHQTKCMGASSSLGPSICIPDMKIESSYFKGWVKVVVKVMGIRTHRAHLFRFLTYLGTHEYKPEMITSSTSLHSSGREERG